MNVEDFWTGPPPELSKGLKKWMEKIAQGWRPNGRIRAMGYYESSQFFKVYIWEYLNVIRPALGKKTCT